MNRKKYKDPVIYLAMILALTLSSCSRTLEDVFDVPATERVLKVIDNCKSTLISSKDGWYMDYTAPDGYEAKFVFRFSAHDSVSTYADFSDLTSISSYSLNYGQGPILSFDSYGQIHTLSDPETAPLGAGHGGDFEFVIMSVTPDSIVLNGRKNRDKVVLYKAQNPIQNKLMIENCKKTLINSPDGWYLDYTTPSNFKAKFVISFFNGDSLRMYSDISNEIKSTKYSFQYAQVPLLSFDSSSELYSLSNQKTNQGDWRFIINTVSADSIILTGRTNHDRVVLHKAISGQENQIRLMKQFDISLGNSINFFHSVTVGSNKADFVLNENRKQFEIATADGAKSLIDINYTPEGFDLASPISVGGTTVSQFVWNNTTKKFVANQTASLDASNSTSFSLGATANQILGSYFDLVAVSPAIASWYSTLSSAFPTYSRSEIYLNAPMKIETVTTTMVNNVPIVKRDTAASISLISYTFLLNKTQTVTVWNNFKGTKITNPREDQILLTQGVRDGENATDLNLNKTVKNIPTLFYNTSGFSVYIRNSNIYLISLKDSRSWFVLRKGTQTIPIQTIYK